MLPVGHQATQEIGTSKYRTVGWRTPAQSDMVSPSGTGVPTIKHKLLGPQPCLVRLLVECFNIMHQFIPVAGRVNIDLDNPRIGGQ